MGNIKTQTSEKFFQLLSEAGAITVDDGALLSDIGEPEPCTGDPENEVVRFSWTDGDSEYSEVLTEGGIAEGVFDSDGKFVCENRDGEKTVLRFFALERLGAEKPVEKRLPPQKIVLVLEGGLVQSVLSAADGVSVAVINYDKNADGDCGIMIPQGGGKKSSAYAAIHATEIIDIERLSELYDTVEKSTSINEIEDSLEEAKAIAGKKASFSLRTADKDISGVMMGETAEHVVVSIGREAVIVEKGLTDHWPAIGQAFELSIKDGKNSVAIDQGVAKSGFER